MEWWQILIFFLGGLVVFLLSGFPIAFSFFFMNILGMLVFMGVEGLQQTTLHISSSLATFTLSPIPMFIIMGELLFHSRIADDTLNILDRWMGRVPGRLGLLASVSGTVFAATSGSSMANTAMLGTALLPEMRARGYSKSMSVGPIIGVGGLAMLIPPSSLAVVLASIGQISVGGLLMAGVIPGILLGFMIGLFIVISAWVKPSLAPPYATSKTSLGEKLFLTVKYFLPVCFIIFMVIGLIIMGLATPTEAAASGAIATLIVTIVYGRFSWAMFSKAMKGSLEITVMILMIIAASKTFSSILAFTGATSGLLNIVRDLDVHPLLVLLVMQLILAFMGCFMEAISIMMICLPVFMPIANMLGFDPVWFGVLMLINLEMGQMTPPFGMLLFVMKAVAPKDITLEDIMLASVPYVLFDIIVIAMIIIWPEIALWLPGRLKSG